MTRFQDPMLLFDGANCCFLLCIFFWNPETLWNQEAPIFRRIRHGGKFLDFQTKAGLWRSVASGKFCAVVVSKAHPSEKRYARQFWKSSPRRVEHEQTYLKPPPSLSLSSNQHETNLFQNHLHCRVECCKFIYILPWQSWHIVANDFVGMFFPIRFSCLIQQATAKNQLPVFASLKHTHSSGSDYTCQHETNLEGGGQTSESENITEDSQFSSAFFAIRVSNISHNAKNH